jgi:predicted kinase/ketosteroid isomerase-like protein
MVLVLVTGLQATGKSTTAAVAADALGAPVLAHDWAMSGLRPYGEVQHALDTMDPPGHRAVGWSLLWALARAQLRRGSPVVLDGVAREPEVVGTRLVAAEEGAACLVVMTTCADVDLHRSRVEGRTRGIPNWYELDWEHVARARASWATPGGVDLVLEAGDPPERNAALVRRAVAGAGRRVEGAPAERAPDGDGPVERFFEHLSARDWTALGQVLAPDVVRVGPLGDEVRGRRAYLDLLERSVPDRYGNDVHSLTYSPGTSSAFARVTEHLRYPDTELHLEEAYRFVLRKDGRVARVEVFWQSPPQQA